MTDQEKLEHKLNNISNAITGLYKDNEVRERETQELQEAVLKLTKVVESISLKVDGDPDQDVTGLRKRVLYLESRDKWLKNKWMFAVGAVGGLTIVYGALKFFDFILSMYKNITHP